VKLNVVLSAVCVLLESSRFWRQVWHVYQNSTLDCWNVLQETINVKTSIQRRNSKQNLDFWSVFKVRIFVVAVKIAEHSVHLSLREMNECVTCLKEHVCLNGYVIVHDWVNWVGISFWSCQNILTQDLNVMVKFIPHLLTDEQKQNHVVGVKTSEKSLHTNSCFWKPPQGTKQVYGYDLKQSIGLCSRSANYLCSCRRLNSMQIVFLDIFRTVYCSFIPQ
jgi:hypothetical protein